MGDPIVCGFPQKAHINIVRLILTHKDVVYSFHDLEPVMGRREHLALHPFNRVPILKHDDLMVYETSAIASYVDEAFGGPQVDAAGCSRPGTHEPMDQRGNSYYYPYMIYHVTHERLVFRSWDCVQQKGRGARAAKGRNRPHGRRA
jgi:glutathione S-transferase